jgi:osmotically-inducible protein OsmY
MKTRTGGASALIAVVLLAEWTVAGAGPSHGRTTASPPSQARLAVATTTTEHSDALVTALVKSKLATNSNTRELRIDVDTKNGVVRLRGEVWSSEERDLVELLARNTEAVMMVRNDLIVRDRGVAGR